MGRSHLPLTK
jgi:transposase-like protein